MVIVGSKTWQKIVIREGYELVQFTACFETDFSVSIKRPGIRRRNYLRDGARG